MAEWTSIFFNHYPNAAVSGKYLRSQCFHLEINKEELLTLIPIVKEKINGRLVTIVGTDQRIQGKDFVLYYVFAIDKDSEHLVISYSISEKESSFPSISTYLPAANWFEREIQDLFGLSAENHPDPSPLVLHGFHLDSGYPLQKDTPRDAAIVYNHQPLKLTKYESDEIVQVPVGPIHAGIIEPGHFRFGAIGESVLHLDAQLFYTHRGIEKSSEGLKIEEALLVAERICGVDVVSHALSFTQAVEKIGGIAVPKRAQYLRSIYLEFERIYNHVGDVGNLGAGAGFAFGVSHGSRAKEQLLRLNQKYLGHRYLRNIIAIGGVKKSLSNYELQQMIREIGIILDDFKEMTEIMIQHEIVLNRMKTTGILQREDADALETVGIAARASGRNVDARRDYPHDAYHDTDFKVILYSEGDVWARAMVRIDEIEQSYSILNQLIAKIPEGETITGYIDLPEYKWAIGVTESPRGENVHFVMTGPNNTVERYRIRSAPYMNWPAVPFTVPGNIIPDFPLINKSFELCYACCDR